MTSVQRPQLLLAVLLVLCLATRIGFIVVLPWCAEDAYITFRYAQNWAHGLGPVYNLGEREWGFTSALWTSFLALTSWIRLPIEGVARWTLTACDLVALALGWRLLVRHSLLAAIGFGLYFALWPRLAMMPASGLESSLVVALLLATATFAQSRAGGVLNGLLALSRPEGAAMSLLLAWRLSLRQRSIWIGVAALQFGFALWFGRWFPSSVSSKATVYGIQARGVQWLEWLIPGLPPLTEEGVALEPIAILLLIGLVAVIVRWRRTHEASTDTPLPVLFACGLLTLFGYTLLGVPWYYWYAPPAMVAMLLAVFLGLATSGVLRWAIGPLALFCVLSWSTVAPRAVRVQTHDADVFAVIGRTLHQEAGGRDASVMLEPIGIIGWLSELRVIDEVGLVTPWVAEERSKADGWYARVIARTRPDYIVYRQNWLDGEVSWAGVGAPFTSRAQRDSIMAAYEVVRRRAGGPLPSGAGRLLILRRRS
jgi:arabinofuranosyltransferase